MSSIAARFVFAVVSLLHLTTPASGNMGCELPDNLMVELEGNVKLFIFDPEVSVEYDRNELVYEYSDTDNVGIHIDDVAVNFSGSILKNEKLNQTINKTINTKIDGTAQLMKNTDGSYAVTNCGISFEMSENKIDKSSNDLELSKYVYKEILHRAARCFENDKCKILGDIGLNALVKAVDRDFKELSDRGLRFNRTSIMRTVDHTETNNVNQSTIDVINVIVDVALSEIIKEMKKENNGLIKIPDIEETFLSPLLNVKIKFNTYNGTFYDIADLKRIDNAMLTREGKSFVVESGFGLSEASIRYEKYTVIYGLKVSGKLTANVKNLSVVVKIEIDFAKDPCEIRLHKLEIKDLTINVKITGFSLLNVPISRLISWIMEKPDGEIVNEIQKQVRISVEELIRNIDCNKFRV